MGFFKKFSNVIAGNLDGEDRQIKNKGQSNKQNAEMMAPQWLKIAGDSVKLVNETTNPKVFFERYDLLIENFEKLAEIENVIQFAKRPSADLENIKNKREAATNDFIDRYSDKLKKEIGTLTTEKSRWSRLDVFDDSISEFHKYLTDKNKEKATDTLNEIREMLLQKSTTNQSIAIQPNTSINTSLKNVAGFVSKFPVVKGTPGSFNWGITVSFGKTTSRNLPNAVFVAKQGRNFKEEEIDGAKIYTVEYTDSREDFKKFIMLYDVAGKWKSTAVFVNGEMIDKKDIAEIKWCYGDKCTSVKADFCYGASEFTENPFGCHRLQISTYNNPWWNYYLKNGKNYMLLKDDLIERINLTYSTFRHCPAFNKERILSVANSLPISLTDKEYDKLMISVNKRLGFNYE
ncbi:MAG: hypothetical protein ACOH15_04325 [Acetobacterium sp.]